MTKAQAFLDAQADKASPTTPEECAALFEAAGAKLYDGGLTLDNNLDHERELAFFKFDDNSTVGVSRLPANKPYEFWFDETDEDIEDEA